MDFIDNQQIDFISTIENSKYKFSFDNIYNPKTSQADIFETSAKPILQSILEGFNGTILAYGQTSSGKTFTMQGDLDNSLLEGIIPRTINMLFESIMDSPEEIEFTVKTSMVEIYMEKIRDLIDTSRMNLNIREDTKKGIYIEDISEYYVSCKEEILELIRLGSENRIQASTNMNENSSRSHSIFIINVHQLNSKDGSAKNSKLVLVDLAGSEKISKTGATGLTLEEAKTINKSLTTLGMVINALTDGRSSHIPYRESKLTRVLQESLGGNSKTCLIITCSPSIYNEAESLSTLRFGNRAKNIKNKPKINKEMTVSELQNIIDSLEKQLAIAQEKISCLENFILNNGLDIPLENELINPKTNINSTEKVKQKDENQLLKESYFYEKSNVENFNIDSNYSNKKLKTDNFIIDKTNEFEQRKYKTKSKDLLMEQLENEKFLNLEKNELIKRLEETINKNELMILKFKENENILNKNTKEVQNQIIELKNENNLNNEETSRNSLMLIENSKRKNQEFCEFFNRNEENNNKYLQEIEELKRELKKSENEKKYILKALEEKSEKIAQQEIETKEFMEMVKILEGNISPEDKDTAKKIISLKRNLEQMNVMYQQIVTQKGVVKCENQILNKKIKQRNDRILLLEKEIQELKENVNIFILIILDKTEG